MCQYYRSLGFDPFEVAIPLTFHIKSQSDPEFQTFCQQFDRKKKGIWIVKPGENSNRGCGIEVTDSLLEIKSMINQNSQKNGTAIIQKYIEKPLLINQRKFDVRAFAMFTSINGFKKGFVYKDVYLRTSSKVFDLTNLANRFVHLTNDAIQQNSEDFGKFESANKLSINDFQKYLDTAFPDKHVNFMRDLFPRMERLITDSFRAVYKKIDQSHLRNTFEIFGYDFMIDQQFKVYLIECNTNPCLEI